MLGQIDFDAEETLPPEVRDGINETSNVFELPGVATKGEVSKLQMTVNHLQRHVVCSEAGCYFTDRYDGTKRQVL